MQITFESMTTSGCISYLLLEYAGKQYSLDEFSATFKKAEYQVDSMLPECKIVYRGTAISFEEYKASRIRLSDQLTIFQKYSNDVLPMEVYLAICNYDYYKAAKFLEKAENCLQTARYYLMQSADIIEYDCNIPWKYGYQPIYEIRATNFTTAIVWYNNCFDYILQIVFLAFELFKKVRRYRADMSFEEKLSLCTFKLFRDLHREHPDNEDFTHLWNILERCHNAISILNEWANYAKHKGGIGYVGLKPDSPFQIYIGTPDGTTESRTSEFESIKLDMDKSVSTLVDVHKALGSCLEEIVAFIDFGACRYVITENGEFEIPDKSSYVKINL